MTDIPIIFECQAADSWRHKFDLWRHRGDRDASKHHILCKIERGTRWWRFHAAKIDSFDAIDSWSWKIMKFAKIWPLTRHNWVKYWSRTKNNTTNREYSARAICWSFPLSSTTLRLETPRGGRTPLHRRRWQNTVYGRGLKAYFSLGRTEGVNDINRRSSKFREMRKFIKILTSYVSSRNVSAPSQNSLDESLAPRGNLVRRFWIWHPFAIHMCRNGVIGVIKYPKEKWSIFTKNYFLNFDPQNGP